MGKSTSTIGIPIKLLNEAQVLTDTIISFIRVVVANALLLLLGTCRYA